MSFVFKELSGEYSNVFRYNIYHEEEEIGFFLFVPHSKEMYEVHTEILPTAWGSAKYIATEWLEYIFKLKPDLQTIVTKVPIHNLLAKKLATRSGFIFCGCIPNSFLHNNIYIDQEMFYLSRSK